MCLFVMWVLFVRAVVCYCLCDCVLRVCYLLRVGLCCVVCDCCVMVFGVCVPLFVRCLLSLCVFVV